MKIDFKSYKWDKEMKELKDVEKNMRAIYNAKKDYYKSDYYVNFEYVYNKFKDSHKPFQDYIWLYACFNGEFRSIAKYYLINNDNKKVIDCTFLSAKAWLLFKEFLDKGIDTSSPNIEINLSHYELIICQLIAVNQLESCGSNFEDSITANLHYMNEEKANKLISEIPDNADDYESIYYETPIFLKEIYKAILERDAKKFNDALIKRIKKYRKNMVGYSTIVDYTSIALLKIAEKYGIEKSINVVEIPEFFWDPTPIDENIRTCIDPSNL